MRRQQLNEAQITALLDPPTDQRELVRHYTLSVVELGAIRRCRGDHNRLGHALMLCYLRYPGRPLKGGERPPRPLLLFIAEQIDALPESRFHRTVLDEFYRVAFRKKIYLAIDELQADLDVWLVEYNEQRPHQGRWCFGKTPMQTFLDALPMAKEKLMAAGRRKTTISTQTANTACQVKSQLIHMTFRRSLGAWNRSAA